MKVNFLSLTNHSQSYIPPFFLFFFSKEIKFLKYKFLMFFCEVTKYNQNKMNYFFVDVEF